MSGGVKVTVSMGGKTVRVEDVKDARVRAGLLGAAQQVDATLGPVTCAEHGRGATNVRVHFDKNGAADLKYDSCCAALGEQIRKVLG
jgi:hypothetical protein